MFNYKIENGKLIKDNSNNGNIFVLNEYEFQNSSLYADYIHHNKTYLKYTKFEAYTDYIFFSLAVPNKQEIEKNSNMDIYIKNDSVVFVNSCDFVNNIINKITELTSAELTIAKFIYFFISIVIENDLLYIDKTEDKLTNIEENLLKGNIDNFNELISLPKKRLYVFYRYYNHLLDICQSLASKEALINDEYDTELIKLLTSRIDRLKNETAYLKEYVRQLQDTYQSQITAKQNDIMTVLTIVTTVVLPLSLIAGWYGMNFKNMPELMWKYGYIYVIVLSVLVVIICLLVFKKKKYF
ncbi:MAG: CorA family divalent cation transporter [Lachnospirales bacterium]